MLVGTVGLGMGGLEERGMVVRGERDMMALEEQGTEPSKAAGLGMGWDLVRPDKNVGTGHCLSYSLEAARREEQSCRHGRGIRWTFRRTCQRQGGWVDVVVREW